MALIGMTAMATARMAVATSENRRAIARGFWAREACIAMIEAQGPGRGEFWDADTLRFERGVWCAVSVERLDHRVNVNSAEDSMLRRVLQSDSLVDALLDWRDADDERRPLGAETSDYRARRNLPPRHGPLASLEELAFVRGFDERTVETLRTVLTASGPGTIDVNTAPARVLRALPLPSSSIDALLVRRTGSPFGSTAELYDYLTSLSGAFQPETMDALRRIATIDRPEFRILVTGAAASGPVVASELFGHITTGGLRLTDRRMLWEW
jgi:hypothetical protein